MKFKRKLLPGLILLLVCFSQGCEETYTRADCILLPAGRINVGPGSVEIFLNKKKIAPELCYNKYGCELHLRLLTSWRNGTGC
jgi:hypothetical protein